MYTDDDQFSDSDSEACSPQVEKREYHNFLERNRRNILKYSFAKLRNAIPSFQKKNTRASRAKILKRSINFIHRANLKRQAREQDVKDLKTDNRLLEEQIQAMQNMKDSTDLASLQALLKKVEATEFKEYEVEPSDTEVDDDDSGESGGETENDREAGDNGPRNKRPRNNWSSEDWDDEVEEEPPKPQTSWSLQHKNVQSCGRDGEQPGSSLRGRRLRPAQQQAQEQPIVRRLGRRR